MLFTFISLNMKNERIAFKISFNVLNLADTPKNCFDGYLTFVIKLSNDQKSKLLVRHCRSSDELED